MLSRCKNVLNTCNTLWGHNAMEVDNHLPDRLRLLVKIGPIEIEARDSFENHWIYIRFSIVFSKGKPLVFVES